MILGARDLEVEAGGTIFYRRGVTVTDNSGLTPELTIDSSRVNLAVPGVCPVTYTARDSSGNESSVTITVTVTAGEADPSPSPSQQEPSQPPAQATQPGSTAAPTQDPEPEPSKDDGSAVSISDRRNALADQILAQITNSGMSQYHKARAIDTDPIYIVFTSGSTGVPKGVAACHRSVLDYITQLSEVLGFDGDTVFDNQSPLYFDACLKELYPALRYGATTYLIPKKLFSMPVALVDYLNRHQINTICWVVSALSMVSAFGTFQEVKPRYLRTVAFGSEVFPLQQFRLWRQALPRADFVNLYGPTGGTGMCCFYRVDREFEDGEPIPIGRPFPNREILLLTPEGAPAKPGEAGELCIRSTVAAEKNPFRVALFLAFFPQLVQDPISRYGELSQTLYAPIPFSPAGWPGDCSGCSGATSKSW